MNVFSIGLYFLQFKLVKEERTCRTWFLVRLHVEFFFLFVRELNVYNCSFSDATASSYEYYVLTYARHWKEFSLVCMHNWIYLVFVLNDVVCGFSWMVFCLFLARNTFIIFNSLEMIFFRLAFYGFKWSFLNINFGLPGKL